jgi:glucokinase
MAERTKYFAGLDLGGSFLKFALGDIEGETIFKNSMPSRADESSDAVFEVMFHAIELLQKKALANNGTLAAIGVGSPGAINFESGRLIGHTPNFKHWENTDIRGALQNKFNIPVWVDNDANIMAFAESRQGAAKGYKNVICTTLGTGIGGGILINGEIYRGTNYAGTEIGHMMIVHDGLPCNCGGRGCFELYAASPAFLREYIKNKTDKNKVVPDHITTKDIFLRADEGDAEANDAIDTTISYLGTGFASLVNIFNPEIIVVGGGVACAGESFIKRIQENIESKAMKPCLKGLKVKGAMLGNDAGFVGAFNLAIEMLQKEN